MKDERKTKKELIAELEEMRGELGEKDGELEAVEPRQRPFDKGR